MLVDEAPVGAVLLAAGLGLARPSVCPTPSRVLTTGWVTESSGWPFLTVVDVGTALLAALEVGAPCGAELPGGGLAGAGLLAGVACAGGGEALGLETSAGGLVAMAWLEAGVAAA